MNNKPAFTKYIREASPDGSNCSTSYIRAIDLLDDILPRKAPGKLSGPSIWSISSTEKVQEIYEYVLEQQRLGDEGVFKNETPTSYWRRRFCSASLKSYKHFLELNAELREMKHSTDTDDIEVTSDGIGEVAKFFQIDLSAEMTISSLMSVCAVSALISKCFLLFTGLSGSGKTKLAQAFSSWISESEDQTNLVAVGADWTSNENLLGYPNALEPGTYCKPDNGVLDLILNAQRDPVHPYFLILDEMNLSHVERYFADFLSAMESGEPIHLHDESDADWNGVPAKLTIPKNLFVIGTVNVDETTYMFSPKVLDRANVIEFRVEEGEMRSFLENPVKPDLDTIAGQGAGYAKAFVTAAGQKDVPIDDGLREQVSDALMAFFPPLKEAGAEFGYRTAHEICRFVYFYRELSEPFDFTDAMDAAVMQKLLPKLHGSKKKLGPVLETLLRLCLKEEARPENDPIKEDILTEENALYPVSLEKLKRMRQRLAEHGFTSFAEA